MEQKLHNILFLTLTIMTAFLLTACGKTLLIENWSDPAYQEPPMKKILIIGVIKGDSKRRDFEDEFSALMTSENLTGIASHSLLPDLEKSGTKENILAIVEKIGADGVMIVTTHGLINQQRVTAPSVDYVGGAGGGYGHGMYGYYGSSYSVVFNQGHTVTDTILRVDIKVFNVSTKKMIWSGKTESLNPTSAKELIAEFERLVIRDMRKNGVIQ